MCSVALPLNVKTRFTNSRNQLVAWTWFDLQRGTWRVSTVPIRTFGSDSEAVAFFRAHCDPETGLLRVTRMARQPKARGKPVGEK